MSPFTSFKKFGVVVIAAVGLALGVSACGGGDAANVGSPANVPLGSSHAFENQIGPRAGTTYEQAKVNLAHDIMSANDPYELTMAQYSVNCLADLEGWTSDQLDNMNQVTLGTSDIKQHVADVLYQKANWSEQQMSDFVDWQASLHYVDYDESGQYDYDVCRAWARAKDSLHQMRG